jgi:hypothetical protein
MSQVVQFVSESFQNNSEDRGFSVECARADHCIALAEQTPLSCQTLVIEKF